MRSQLAHLYLALRDFVEPLRRRLSTLEGVEYVFHRYGWIAPLDEPTFGQVRDALGVLPALQQFLTVADAIRDRLDDDPDAGPTPTEVVQLIESGGVMVAAIARIGDGAGALPPPFDRPELWESLGRHVLDDLVDEYVRIHLPGLYAVVRIAGVIRHEPTAPVEPFRRPYTRIRVDWHQLIALVEDPGTAIAHAYHWGEPGQPFAYERALESFAAAARALHVVARPFVPALERRPPFGSEPDRHVALDALALRTVFRVAQSRTDGVVVKAGLDVMPALRTGEDAPTGLILRPILVGSAGTALPVGPFQVTWNTSVGLGDAVGAAIFPDDVGLIGGEAAFATAVELAPARPAPWRLLGTEQTTRLELTGLSARFALEGTPTDPDVTLRVAATELALIFDPAGSGRFAGSLGGESRRFSAAAAFEWSSKRGMTFTGRGGLSFGLTSPRKLGGITLDDARLALAVDGGGLRLAATVSGSVALGPVTASVAGIGVAATVRPRPGVVDPSVRDLEVDFVFQPPDGIGLAMDTPAVKLGGFLGYQRATGRYVGSVELRLIDRLEVSAVGLLDTRMPDGGDGFSLVVTIGTTFPRPIPLGANFYLVGVGGLLGMHRGVDLDRLRAGLRDGVVDHLLFPTAVVANMTSIVSDLSEVFPIRRGQFVIGPTAKLCWNVPPLVTAEVGLIVETPSPTRIALVGAIHAAVPRADAAVLVLNADFLGAIDLATKMLSFDASIHDSYLGRGSFKFTFEGDLALRASWGGRNDFVATVGGFHPDYHPAAELRLPALRRVTISLLKDNPRLTLSAYFALTSNTIQVGAELDFKFGVSGFDVVGRFGFDALFQLSPFGFVAAVRAHLAVRAGGSTLFSVNLEFELHGTTPWLAKGSASFKICWFLTIKVRFEKTWGENAAIAEPLTAVLPEILDELARAANWTTTSAAGSSILARLRGVPVASTVSLLDPAGLLSVGQRAVPLGTTLERFGASRPSDAERVDIGSLRVGAGAAARALALDDVRGEFAPASFRELDDRDKLRAASYESRKRGVVARDLGAITDYVLPRPVTYERIISDASGREPPRRDREAGLLATFDLFVPGGTIGASPASRRAAVQREVASVLPIGAAEPRFAVVSASNLRAADPASASLTREQAERRRRDLIADGEDANALEIVPEHEMAS